MALLELLVADEHVRHDARRRLRDRLAAAWQAVECPRHEIAHLLVLDVADGRDDQVRRACTCSRNSGAARPASSDSTVSLRAENRPAQRMVLPRNSR